MQGRTLAFVRIVTLAIELLASGFDARAQQVQGRSLVVRRTLSLQAPAWHPHPMSQVTEVTIVLGLPDYDIPLDAPFAHPDGLAVTGRDSLGYLWRFSAEGASLWARRDDVVGESRGEIALPHAAPADVDAQCALLRDAQAHRREVQTAYATLAETLLSMAGDAPDPGLLAGLHDIRTRCGAALLMFTDPSDDGAHGAFREMPDVPVIHDLPADERAGLRPLAERLLDTNAALLGIEDPQELLSLAR